MVALWEAVDAKLNSFLGVFVTDKQVDRWMDGWL